MINLPPHFFNSLVGLHEWNYLKKSEQEYVVFVQGMLTAKLFGRSAARGIPYVRIVIVISKFLKRYSKAKCTRAPAYSRALRRIKGGFFQRGGQEKTVTNPTSISESSFSL